MDEEDQHFLDGLSRDAARDMILSEGEEPEYISYSEMASDLVEFHNLTEDEGSYLEKRIQTYVEAAEITIEFPDDA